MFNEQWCVGNNFNRCLNIFFIRFVRSWRRQAGSGGATRTSRQQKIIFPHIASFFSFSLFVTTLVLFFSSSPALTILKSSSLTGKPLVESSRSSTRSCHPPSLHVVCVSIPFLSLMNRNLITGLHLSSHLFLLRLLGFDVLSSSTGSGYGLAYRWLLTPD